MRRSEWRNRLLVLALLAAGQATAAVEIRLPNKADSLHFAVIGDNGTGSQPEYDIAGMLRQYHDKFNFDVMLMNGDNLYGGESPSDFMKKFQRPYQPLLDQGVKFYPVLGNHDDPNERLYKNWNMNGQRYYTFSPKRGIKFFALDSNYMDKTQLDWAETQLRNSNEKWKIAYFHHPLYSSGKAHGPALELRKVLEPLLVKYGVSLALAGHEHFYERINPQSRIYYFISGAAGELRKGNINMKDLTAKGFDADNSFLLMEIDGDMLYFQAISRTGETVDTGSFERRKWEEKKVSKLPAGKRGEAHTVS